MEKDVDLIIDVEPKEAELLAELIETLLDDWYVERAKRQQRNSAMKALAASKLDAKRQGKQKKNDGSSNEEPSSSNA
jgi:stalled ribosome alternative rescue factor ArfA